MWQITSTLLSNLDKYFMKRQRTWRKGSHLIVNFYHVVRLLNGGCGQSRTHLDVCDFHSMLMMQQADQIYLRFVYGSITYVLDVWALARSEIHLFQFGKMENRSGFGTSLRACFLER
jgi:hypothetical protein